MMRFGCFALLIGLTLAGCPQPTPPNDDGDPNDPGGGGGPAVLGVDLTIPNEGARHVAQGTQVTYATRPPASGSHWPIPAARGFYDVAVEEEAWVHSLEHGYVVLLFDCRGSCDPALIGQLQLFFSNAPPSAIYGYPKLVISPFSGLPEGALLTVVAWDHQLHLAAFDEAAILAFYNQYQDQGPEDVP